VNVTTTTHAGYRSPNNPPRTRSLCSFPEIDAAQRIRVPAPSEPGSPPKMPQNSFGPRPDARIAAAVTTLPLRLHSEKINSIIRVISGVAKAAVTGAKGRSPRPGSPPRPHQGRPSPFREGWGSPVTRSSAKSAARPTVPVRLAGSLSHRPGVPDAHQSARTSPARGTVPARVSGPPTRQAGGPHLTNRAR
jgi:hypothetical protein